MTNPAKNESVVFYPEDSSLPELVNLVNMDFEMAKRTKELVERGEIANTRAAIITSLGERKYVDWSSLDIVNFRVRIENLL